MEIGSVWRRAGLMGGAGAALLLAGAPAAAQEAVALEEIIVTATKRETTLQDTPLSVSVVQGAALAEQGARTFEEIGGAIPNFSVAATPIGDTITIRGISTFTQPGTEQSVVTFVDGVFRGRGVQSRFAFLDMGALEVVRGPQGALFGKNTVAGALNITSARPTSEATGLLAAAYEFRTNETELAGHLSGPISDRVRIRLAGQWNDQVKGWVKNLGYDETLPTTESWAVRGALEADLADGLELYARVEHGDFHVDGQPYEVSRLYSGDLTALPATARLITQGLIAAGDTGRIDGVSIIRNRGALDTGSAFLMDGESDEALVRLDWEVGPGVLTTMAARSNYAFERVLDSDNGPLSVLQTREWEGYEQDSLEFRYASDSLGRVTLLFGGYWQQADLTSGLPADGLTADFSTLGVPVPVVRRNNLFVQDQETWSGFLQAAFEISPDLVLTAGTRRTTERKDATQSVDFYDLAGARVTGALRTTYGALLSTTPHVLDLETKESDWTYSLNLRWNPTDRVMTYASFGTGVKGGGFNAYYYATGGARAGETADQFQARMKDEATFAPERSRAWELGAKLSPSPALQINLAAFFSTFKDLQVTQFTGATTFIVDNAARAESYGIEADARWRLSSDLELFGSVGWLNFEFTEFPNAGCTAVQSLAFGGNVAACSAAGANDLGGRTNVNAPEWNVVLGGQYARELSADWTLKVRAEGVYVSDYYAANDLDPDTLQEGHVKLNAAFTLAYRARWQLSLIGRNLTDELTYADANDLPLATGTIRAAVQAPRTVALRLQTSF